MITSTLRTILERAASDAAFRKSLLHNPDSALIGFALSADEAAMVHSLSEQQLAQLAKDMNAMSDELSDEMLQAAVGGAGPVTTNSSMLRCTGTC
jgi:hypothetical protein